MPVIGNLFGNNSGDATKTEIVLSITPHIIRAPALLDASVREVFSGTESSIRERALQLDPVGGVRMPVSEIVTPAARPGAATTSPPPIGAQASTPVLLQPAASASGPTAAASAPTPAESYMRRLLPLMNGRKNVPDLAPAPTTDPVPAASAASGPESGDVSK